MIEKVKNFVKEHWRVFLVGGVLFAIAVTTAIVYSETKNKNSEDVTEKEYYQIVMSLENAKAIMDANADNESKYAIIRGESSKKDDYVCISFDPFFYV